MSEIPGAGQPSAGLGKVRLRGPGRDPGTQPSASRGKINVAARPG